MSKFNFGETIGYVIRVTNGTFALVDKAGVSLPQTIQENLIHGPTEEDYKNEAYIALFDDSEQSKDNG